MGLAALVKKFLNDNDQVAYRPTQAYTNVVGAYTIFTVSGGPIEALGLFGMHTAAAGGATTVAGTLNGVAGDSGAVDIGTAAANGIVVWYPLNVGGAILVAAAFPRTVATSTPMVVGTSAGGLIVMTYAVSTCTMSWSLVYRKLSPMSRVV
jgi:hypothetical protein